MIKMNSLLLIAITGFVGFFSFSDCQSIVLNTEKRLVKHLQDNYEKVGKYGRPGNSSLPLDVTVGFSLIQILDFDQLNQVLQLVGWLYLSWDDPLLTWQPSNQDNIATVLMPITSIWSPDIVAFNIVDKPVPTHDAQPVISSEGNVIWVTPNLYKITCVTSPEEKDPTCYLKFGSWSMNKDQINLIPLKDRIDAGYYIPHHDWELGKTKAVKSDKEYPCCPGVYYSDITYSFTLELREPEPEPEPDNLAANIQMCPYVILSSLLIVKLLFL